MSGKITTVPIDSFSNTPKIKTNVHIKWNSLIPILTTLSSISCFRDEVTDTYKW